MYRRQNGINWTKFSFRFKNNTTSSRKAKSLEYFLHGLTREDLQLGLTKIMVARDTVQFVRLLRGD